MSAIDERPGENPSGSRPPGSGMSDYRRMEQAVDVSEVIQPDVAEQPGAAEDELLTINFGPHHPATHGVLRLMTTIEGEVIRDTKPVLGYVHTGIEKTLEDKAYWKGIPLIERMDYLSYFFNAHAYCGAVETLLDVEVPRRAQVLRVIHLELNRLMSHVFWFGSCALDLGAITAWWYAFRDRESLLDLFEYSTGQRMHTRYFQVGGVMEDVPDGWMEKVRDFCEAVPRRLADMRNLVHKNEIWLRRMRNTGVITTEQCHRLGVTGPILRSTGDPWDLRKAMPYLIYDELDFKIPVGANGDNYDRYAIRLAEAEESAKMVLQCLELLEPGPVMTDDRKVGLPPRHELATSMEALIHHFKLVTEGFRVPPGEVYFATESPRGELACFVRSDGSSKPARVHMRDPSFTNLQITGNMVRDGYIADFIASLATIDPILGGVDR